MTADDPRLALKLTPPRRPRTGALSRRQHHALVMLYYRPRTACEVAQVLGVPLEAAAVTLASLCRRRAARTFRDTAGQLRYAPTGRRPEPATS